MDDHRHGGKLEVSLSTGFCSGRLPLMTFGASIASSSSGSEVPLALICDLSCRELTVLCVAVRVSFVRHAFASLREQEATPVLQEFTWPCSGMGLIWDG